MDTEEQLTAQIKLVINTLENEYSKELNSGILKLIYKRYLQALEILEKDKNIEELNIEGGVRAYLDAYSDYQNPLLDKMHKAEKILNNLKTT
ncbi:hypothetical protein AB1K91_01605 [Terribacillus sp. 179-K 1B1 HS]|uniref:hypothetical protein n=1 Tax=Terribacillus sp. 179-K 1B1 HS TaxID=3142388 RepID=UPI00399F9888